MKICIADKNLGFTTTTNDWYHAKALEHLNNTTTYTHINNQNNCLKNLWIQLRKILARNRVLYIKDNNKIRFPPTLSKLAKYILQLETPTPPKAGKFYLTIKIHKTPTATRPIINTRGTPTYHPSKYLHHVLAPVMQNCSTYIQNSSELIRKLEKISLPNAPVFLLAADIKELYPSIPIEDGLHALQYVLRNSEKWEPDTISFIMELAEYVLRNNYFTYNDTLYLQIFGTAMGTSFAPAYATIYLHVIETEIWQAFRHHQPNYEYPLLITRYIDDVFGIFHSEQSLMLFVKLYNEARPTIQLIITAMGNTVDILDMTVFTGDRYKNQNKLDIKIFQKEMNKYLYIPPDSYHTKASLRSFISSELRRYRILCTNDIDYNTIKTLFYQRLARRDYTSKFLNPLFQVELNRNSLLYPPKNNKTSKSIAPTVFKIFNTPRFSHNQLKDMLKIPEELMHHPHFTSVFHCKQPTICYKRTRNIKELIDKNKSPK
jgi:hypothetical protein